MKPFGKGLLIGSMVGVAATLLLEIVVVAGMSFWISRQMGREEASRGMLPRVSLPEDGQLWLYGTADFDWPLQTLDGEQVSLADFRGRTVFLNIWATWCMPCVAEMPEIVALADSLAGEDVAMVVVSMEPAEAVGRLAEQRGWTIPLYVSPGDPPSVFSAQGVPVTYIIDPDGVIVHKQLGAARWNEDPVREFLLGLRSSAE
jgi:thiol-disulfide isomerase/thioredoxin